MMYRTKQGETWDSIAKALFGDERAAQQLMEANMSAVGAGYMIFPAGVELEIPVIDRQATQAIPPWRISR